MTDIVNIIPSPVCGASLADELSMIEGSKRKMLPTQDSCEVDSLPEDFGNFDLFLTSLCPLNTINIYFLCGQMHKYNSHKII